MKSAFVSVTSRILILISVVMILVVGYFGYRYLRKWSWENESIHMLEANSGVSDEKNGIYLLQFDDGTWFVTRFMEECCGDSFDGHVIKTSRGEMYSIEYHYCGTEGMDEIRRYNKGLDGFISKIKGIRKIQ